MWILALLFLLADGAPQTDRHPVIFRDIDATLV
jgi:hypothetical protein